VYKFLKASLELIIFRTEKVIVMTVCYAGTCEVLDLSCPAQF